MPIQSFSNYEPLRLGFTEGQLSSAQEFLAMGNLFGYHAAFKISAGVNILLAIPTAFRRADLVVR